ncbi:NAD(P)/FAD-dependent oxidoreductase [Oceanobacillus alkalisoli]|uniref:NAD(P)/FAD-dependent oxidoreductase n=1 Tax=Oceanobacillus alkalisoli TaxID=2925113 RepID=UPI001EE3B8B4|nr:FAD-dependent oxidoreductase [Oceanobacillus alkalisoli]MCG5102097.1 FAD-binding oxidoreductase [Oceanobacillus alkalisoli]
MSENIIIIGGGIAGASAAYHLSKKGVDVTLIDRHDTGQATDAAAGIICPWLAQRRNKAWYRLVKMAAKMYPDLIKELETAGETDTGYKQVGALNLHNDEKKLHATLERVLKRREDAPEIGEIELLDETTAQAKFPLLNEGYQAVFVGGAARVDGRKLRDALIRSAKKNGAKIIEGSAELLVEGTQVRGVQIDGEKYASNQVIATTGAWMNELLEPFDITGLNVRPQKAQILHLRYDKLDTENLPVIKPPGNQYMLSFEDHRFVVGATIESKAGYDTNVTAAGMHEVLSKALEVAPDLKDSAIIEARVGFRPMTNGSLPVIGSLDGLDGLVYANGLGASGLTAGPLMGQQLAKLAVREETDLNLEDYHL